MRRLTVVATLIALVALAAPAAAQPADLRGRVEALESEIAELRALAAKVPTLSQTAEELASRVAVITQELEELSRQREAVPEAVTTIDELTMTVRGLERELERLRTQVAGIEQPSVAAGPTTAGGGVVHDSDGFGWLTDDGRFALRLGGYLQARYQLELEGGFDGIDVSTFRIRRGRIGAEGHLGDPRLQFKLLAELIDTDAPLRDYYLDYEVSDELTIRAGQAKLQLFRSFLTSSRKLAFLERSVAVDAFRYDRDLGVWLHGELFGGVRYYGGISNGAGANARNDNIDFVSMLRIEGAVLGTYFSPSFGDVTGTEVPSLVLGGAVAHDLVRLPERVSGIEVGQRDVDADGTFDNVRVLTGGIDAIFRYQGLELVVEGMWRQERWGTILSHSDNSALASAVDSDSSGVENYFGGYGQATYFVMPELLLVGARVAHTRIPLLGVGGRDRAAPPIAPRALQIDGLVQLYDDGLRVLGLDYTFTNYDTLEGPDPAGDMEHRFILETQLVW